MNAPLSRRLWAVQWSGFSRTGKASVHAFHTEEERTAWVQQQPHMREPVDESNPFVRQYRERMGT